MSNPYQTWIDETMKRNMSYSIMLKNKVLDNRSRATNIAPMSNPYQHLINQAVAKIPTYYKGLDRISWRMNSTMRTTAGVSKFSRITGHAVVELSESLFARLSDAERMNIITHELAHAVLQVNRQSDGHGPLWRSLHRYLGGDGERCHQHEVVHNDRKRVILMHTSGKGVACITIQKWNKLQYRNIPYRFVGEVVVNLNNKTYMWSKLVNEAERGLSLPFRIPLQLVA